MSTVIVTRTRNRPRLLDRAIRSVLGQTVDDWHHVIVNDGGDAQSLELLCAKYKAQYRDRLSIIHNSESRGMEAASNKGIIGFDSQFILIHDDDDSLDPHFLELTTAYLASPPVPSIGGVCTLVSCVEERIVHGQIIEQARHVFRILNYCLSFSDTVGINPVPPISFLFRRDIYEAVGRFDESLPVLGDWDFLLRYLWHCDIGIVPQQLANYHIRPRAFGAAANSISGSTLQFELLTKVIRNKYLRDPRRYPLGLVLQDGAYKAQLERLYRHGIIGNVIKFWARHVNAQIPGHVS